MLCVKLHYQKGFNLVLFSYNVGVVWQVHSTYEKLVDEVDRVVQTIRKLKR